MSRKCRPFVIFAALLPWYTSAPMQPEDHVHVFVPGFSV